MRFKHIIIGFCVIITLIFLIMMFAMRNGDLIELTGLPDELGSATAPIIGDSPMIGADNPVVTIYIFGDFANATSNTLSTSLNSILEKYPDELAIVWKDYPNATLDDNSLKSAIAARCAQKQDKFWEFHDFLINNSDILSDDLYSQIATQLDLWEWSFNRCVDKEKTLSLIQNDILLAHELSVPASPTLFINNERISGYISKQELEQLILSAQE